MLTDGSAEPEGAGPTDRGEAPGAQIRGSKNRALWLATFGFFGGFAGVAVFGPLVPDFKDAMGLSAVEAGLLAGIPNFTGSVLRMPFGAWVDKSGGRKPFLVLLGLTLAGMAGLIALLATRWPNDMDGMYPVLLVLGVFIGASIASFSVGIPQVAYWFPKREQGGPLGIYAGLGNVAPGLSSLALPLVVAGLTIEWAYGIWWAILAVITIVYALYITDAPWFQLRSRGVEVSAERLRELGQDLIPSGSTWAGLKKAAATVETWPLVYFYFVSFGGFLALIVFFPTFWDEVYGLSKGERGGLTAAFGLTTALIRVPGGMLSDRISIRWALTGNFLLIGAGAVVIALSSTLAVSIVAMLTIAVGMGLQNAIVFKLVPHYVPGAVGGASGWVGGLGAFSGFLLPPIMGAIAGGLSGELAFARPFLVVTGLVALGLLIVGWLTRWSWRTELAPAAPVPSARPARAAGAHAAPAGPARAAPHVAITVEIASPPELVWRALGRPERWQEGFRETRSRSADYPGPNSQNDHVFHTRIDEHVVARVIRSEPPSLLEEEHDGRTFARRVRYHLAP
ncbi:MAG: MFS transporter, partial [Gaiellales bacterium]